MGQKVYIWKFILPLSQNSWYICIYILYRKCNNYLEIEILKTQVQNDNPLHKLRWNDKAYIFMWRDNVRKRKSYINDFYVETFTMLCQLCSFVPVNPNNHQGISNLTLYLIFKAKWFLVYCPCQEISCLFPAVLLSYCLSCFHCVWVTQFRDWTLY